MASQRIRYTSTQHIRIYIGKESKVKNGQRNLGFCPQI